MACEPGWKGSHCYLHAYWKILDASLATDLIQHASALRCPAFRQLVAQGFDIKKHMTILNSICHDTRRPATEHLLAYSARGRLLPCFGTDMEMYKLHEKAGRCATAALATLAPGHRTLCYSREGLWYRPTAHILTTISEKTEWMHSRQEQRTEGRAGPQYLRVVMGVDEVGSDTTASKTLDFVKAYTAHPADACKSCGKKRCHVKISLCVRCGEVGYCSTECQHKDWRRHKQSECRPTSDVRVRDVVEIIGTTTGTDSVSMNGRLFKVLGEPTPERTKQLLPGSVQHPPDCTAGRLLVIEDVEGKSVAFTFAAGGLHAKPETFAVHSKFLQRTTKELDNREWSVRYGAAGEPARIFAKGTCGTTEHFR